MENLFGDFFDEEIKIDERYTHKVKAPLYQPQASCPHILELVNTEKTKRLIRQIESSNISDFEKKFLIEAAHRHSIFNYSKIADYYCHASKEMQELMEKSALVIIDFDKAIENGYVRLSENIRKIQEASGRWANEEEK
jgi:hypothetical protein